MPDSIEKIAIKCACGARLRVPSRAIGKRIKCPKCEKPVLVQKAAPRPVSAAPVASSGGGADDLLGAMNDFESSATTKASTPTRPPVSDGFSDPAFSPPETTPKTKKKSVGKAAAGAASSAVRSMSGFGVGMICSAIGAAIGGAIWFAIAWYGEVEVGWIAILVGFLAGLGMAVGNPDAEDLSGLAAAGNAVLGIGIAKYIIFAMIIANFSASLQDSINVNQWAAESIVQDQILAASNLTVETAPEARAEAAYTEAEQRVSQMSEAEIQALLAEHPEVVAEIEEIFTVSGLEEVSFTSTLVPFDGLWFLLAGFAAYRAGGGGNSE